MASPVRGISNAWQLIATTSETGAFPRFGSQDAPVRHSGKSVAGDTDLLLPAEVLSLGQI